MSKIIQNVKTHLITGFLGSGKTTFLNNLIAHFQTHDNIIEQWAILINEAGKIGIDGALIDKNNHIATKEINGGCICCTSQLPLQIAISRLLTEQKPDRLIIEPTGLAHPKELTEQLTAPHWQTALSLKSVFCVLNAQQWQQEKYQNHEHYQAHVCFADVIIINRFENFTSDINKQNLIDWIISLNKNAVILWQKTAVFDDELIIQLSKILNQNSQLKKPTRQFFGLISNQLQPTNITINATQNHDDIPPQLPFRYHEQTQTHQIIGWQLPQDWQTDIQVLINWLLTLPNWERIKGVIHTPTGFQQLNFTQDSINLKDCEPQVDNRIEVIFFNNEALDFAYHDNILISLFKQN